MMLSPGPLRVSPLLVIEREKGCYRAYNAGQPCTLHGDQALVRALARFATPADPVALVSSAALAADEVAQLADSGLLVAAVNEGADERAARSRACIATTMRRHGPGRAFATFVRYHLCVGFERVYVFFEDPEDPALDLVNELPGVTAILVDRDLRGRQRIAAGAAGRAVNAGPGMLNLETAMTMARADGWQWLVHLDPDELLLTEEPLHRHFSRLPPSVGQVVYFNQEAALPGGDGADPFRGVTLFKKNAMLCDPARIAEVCQRTGRDRFHAGDQGGRAAVRLAPGARPFNMNHFLPSLDHQLTVTSLMPLVLHYLDPGQLEDGVTPGRSPAEQGELVALGLCEEITAIEELLPAIGEDR